MTTNSEPLQSSIDDAILEYTLGNLDSAKTKLVTLTTENKNSFDAWLALTEVYYALSLFQESKSAAESAYAISPNDIHINTSLSRIWMQLGDKKMAEHFGAEARRLSWKEQLKSPPPNSDTELI